MSDAKPAQPSIPLPFIPPPCPTAVQQRQEETVRILREFLEGRS